MKKFVDLHCHSSYSDGNLSVSELIIKAKASNVDCLSITDHDNVDSIKEILSYKDDSEIKLISGVELSSVLNFYGEKKYIHLLGYDFDCNSNLTKELKRYKQNLIDNNIDFLKNIKKFIRHIPNCIFEELDCSNYKLLQNQITTILIKYGFSNEYILDFQNQIFPFIPNYDNYEMDTIKAIELINELNGVAVLAHPNKLELSNSELDDLVSILTRHGLKGIETFHSSFNEKDFELFKQVAIKNRLLQSVGSDYHFDTKDDNIVLGYGINNNLCQETCSVKEHILTRR